MTYSLLATKFYVPQRRPNGVARSRLIERLDEGLASGGQLSLISAPAGFGKTTLLSEWVSGSERPAAWLSLDEDDNDTTRFLAYLIAALQTIIPQVGEKLLGALQSSPPPSSESILTSLLNEIGVHPQNFILVLDDYHVVEAQAVDQALGFLLGHLPPQMHLVIATREDPHLPLSRLRAQGKLTELRAADLRFTPSEAAEFLNRVMGLNLLPEDISALEARTEGWIAGLQLAAISMQGHKDSAGFIRSFTGSHHFVMDYLVEEVLQQQSEDVQTFLLRTSILDRLCASLCDAVLADPASPAQESIEYLEHANLFVVPLDNERRWYRYHRLFAELLRQRLQQGGVDQAQLHQRASQWYEDNGLDIEAFQHAAAANDIERAERLLEGRGVPLYQRGGMMPVLKWLESLPEAVLDARPQLWVFWGSASVSRQSTRVEEKLRRAEAALQGVPLDDRTRDLHGRIAATRAMLAVGHYDVETIIAQSNRALEYLHPENLSYRFRAILGLANAYEFTGERAALEKAYTEALSVAQASGNALHIGIAIIGLGLAHEYANELHPAAEHYRRAVPLLSDQSPPILSYAYLGLGRILYEWNDLEAAEQHLQQGLQLARQYDRDIDVFIICEMWLARLDLAQGEAAKASAILEEALDTARQRNFALRLPEIAAAQVLALLPQGKLTQAAALAQSCELPLSRARVCLAQGKPEEALALIRPYREQMEARGWADERLHAMLLQVLAHRAHGERNKALHVLGEALVLAEPGGLIRSFVDEGAPMQELLSEAASQGLMPAYARTLLAAFGVEKQGGAGGTSSPAGQLLIEPLSDRELEILHLIAQGLSNQEISARLFLALSTVKGHNRVIFNKLQVQRRTEAVARARELGLLQPEHPGD